MSASRPLQRILAPSRIWGPRQPVRRCLHSSPRLRSDDGLPKPKSPSPNALGLPKGKKGRRISGKDLPPLTQAELEGLKGKYSAEQMAAIKAGEAAIDPQDMADQAVLRQGPMSVNYLDDFSTIHPVIDKAVKAPAENYDPNLRFKTEDELAEDLSEWLQDIPEDAQPSEWKKFVENTRLTVGKPEAELNPRSSEAPRLHKITDPLVRAQARASRAAHNEEEEMTEHFERLSKQTGIDVEQMKTLRIKTLVTRRVVNQTRMGKIASQYYLTVAGNRAGLLGIGEGKADEAEDARRQAMLNAIRNLQPVMRYEERTIFGDVKGKVGATELELFTRPPGFGIRCQDKIYEMCKCAGISDLSARVTRSRNPMNIVKATMEALLGQRNPEDISRARGKKLVDVRKVYYAGM